MKYFTEEYLEARKYIESTEDFSSFENEEFERLYSIREEEYIKKAKKLFDTPVQMIQTREEIEANYDPMKYPKYDFRAKRIVGYMEKEEVLKAYDYQAEKQKRLFENRGEFNYENAKKRFRSRYEEKLSSLKDTLPPFLLETNDCRMLALDYAKKDSFRVLEEQREKWKKITDDREIEYREYLNGFALLPKKIQYIFLDKKSTLLDAKSEKGDLILTLRKNGILKKGETNLKQYIFKSFTASSFENFQNRVLQSNFHPKQSICEKTENGYHAEMLLEDKEESFEFSFFFLDVELKLNA